MSIPVKTVTVVVMCVVTGVLVVWDIIAAAIPPPGDTISKVFLDGCRHHPSLSLAAGALLGHLTWTMQLPHGELAYWRWSLPVLGLLIVAAVVLDFLGYLPLRVETAFALGYIIGHFTWPQASETGDSYVA